ncbi:hypothetical protein ACOME3_010794 [Neoechinorhynchus agilis]
MDLEFKQPQRLRRVKSADFPESPYKEPMRSISIERDVPLDIKSHECQYSSDVSKHQNRKHKERPMNVINIRSDPQKSPIPKPDPRSKRRTLRSPKAGRLVCDVCDKFGTYSADKFYIHMAAHRNLKPFKCSYCGQRANYKSDVQKHIRNRKKYEAHDGVVQILPEVEARATIDDYILERHRQSTQRRRTQVQIQSTSSASLAILSQTASRVCFPAPIKRSNTTDCPVIQKIGKSDKANSSTENNFTRHLYGYRSYYGVLKRIKDLAPMFIGSLATNLD